jgi:hypothetical protein
MPVLHAPDRAPRAPLHRQADHNFEIYADGRLVATIPMVGHDCSDRNLMKLVVAALPEGVLSSSRHIEIRNAYWELNVPVRGPAATVIADGVRLMHFFTRVDILRDRQRGHARDRGLLVRLAPHRHGSRARGAGRPRGRRASAASRSGTSSGDDGPPGHLGPAGGRSRHSTQQQAVIAW